MFGSLQMIMECVRSMHNNFSYKWSLAKPVVYYITRTSMCNMRIYVAYFIRSGSLQC